MSLSMAGWTYIDGKKPFWKCPVQHDGFDWCMDANRNVREFFRCKTGDFVREYNIPIPMWLQDEIIKNNKNIPIEMSQSDIEKSAKAIKQIQDKKNARPELFSNPPRTEYDSSRIGIVPDILTVELLQKWKTLSTFERILKFQTTTEDRIEERMGRGGKKKYVKGRFMDQEANLAFLFSMSTHIDGWHLDVSGVSCWGHIVFEMDGKSVTVSDVGTDIQEYSKDTQKPVFTIPEMMKAASTDMRKRCLAQKGFNGDVYRGEI